MAQRGQVVYEDRTLQFLGLAYGNSNVLLTATINGTTVFSGEVPTIDAVLPTELPTIEDTDILFSVDNSTLFPTDFHGSYPMSIAVTGGNGIILSSVYSNYQTKAIPNPVIMANSSIQGNVLTVGSVVQGEVHKWLHLSGDGINITGRLPGLHQHPQINGGSGNTWTITTEQSVTDITITGTGSLPGKATEFGHCYQPSIAAFFNSEGTLDVRSNVMIDGVQQVPPRAPSTSSAEPWIVHSGSTITHELNLTPGIVPRNSSRIR